VYEVPFDIACKNLEKGARSFSPDNDVYYFLNKAGFKTNIAKEIVENCFTPVDVITLGGDEVVKDKNNKVKIGAGQYYRGDISDIKVDLELMGVSSIRINGIDEPLTKFQDILKMME
jgi:hypothetical protein